MLFKNIGLIDENFEYKENMYVGTNCHRIVYIDSKPPENEEVFFETYDGRGKVLMPAFYNAHGHSPMSLMRGYGENLPLDRWLNDRIFPFEDKLYSEAVYWATMLTMAESIRFGIVSTTDMYYFIDDMVRAVVHSGVKTNISRAVTNFGTPVSESASLKEAAQAIEMYYGFEDGRILVDASAHAEYTNDFEMIKAIADMAKHYDVRTHVHLSETESEHKNCIEKYGKTPAEVFLEAGMFDVPCTAAHCTWVTNSDLDIFKEKGVTVASNPCSNMKLASGMCNVPPMYKKGINVAIGTDSVASNNSLNFFEEMKFFALTGKVTSMDPATMTPQQVLRSATRAGALSQGREDCGLVKEGFKADLIVVDKSGPNWTACDDIANGLIYSADGKDVCLTMCDGMTLYRDGEYTFIDIEKTCAEAENAKAEILKKL
ncbi:MAG: amidohydrolase [Mogibacterium sp.]|nr:amidohydrolase [Mogibacterium sp.]MBR3376155.1 amidohydrolase [Mogibacterium sp.]